jgi:hypothetical protein
MRNAKSIRRRLCGTEFTPFLLQNADYNGLDREGFHPYFTREGKLRGGLEFLCEEPAILPPWKTTAK